MDSVQKVGNGHPGTAMSLAPAAYLLFQKVMRHDPSDPHWPGRDRFVLSCGHSSVTLYIQLYLGGWGLELEDLKSLRTWGSKTPGHPEYGHTAGVETTTGPARARASATRSAWRWPPAASTASSTPTPPRASRPSTTTSTPSASDGDLEEGVSGEASSIAGTQQLGNLILIYDDNADLDRGRHRHRVHRGRRRALRGLRLARPDGRLDPRRHGSTDEDVPALHDAILKAQRRHRQAELHPAAHDHRLAGAQPPEHLQGPRHRPRRRRGGRHQEDPRLRPGADLRGPARRHRAHPRGDRARHRPRGPSGRRRSTRGRASRRRTSTSTSGCRPARSPRAGPTTLPSFPADEKGMATRKASGEVHQRASPPRSPSCGAARPTWPSPTTPRSRARRRSSRATARPRALEGRPATPAGCCTSASASTPWARS